MKAGKLCGVLLLLAALLTGCQMQRDIWDAAESGEGLTVLQTLGESGDLSYPVPRQKPMIRLDQVGYRPEGRKIAMFCSREKPETEPGGAQGTTFRVVDCASGLVVYTGVLEEKGMDEETGEYISYGTFTEVSAEGDYYLEADGIGRSCRFCIREDIYDEVFWTLYQELTETAQSAPPMEQCYLLANLLTAEELYPQVYARISVAGGASAMPPALQSAETLLALLREGQREDGGIADDPDLSAAFAGTAAQYARLSSGYDASLAAVYRQAAEQAFRYASQHGAADDKRYYAAAQLFRLTGDNAFHRVIRDRLASRRRESGDGTDLELYGDIAYLMTEKNVDVELCRTLMTQRMTEVETIAALSHRTLYQTAADGGTQEAAPLLKKMVKLAFVDYVITNHEYATVMESHLHFFLGANPQAASYLSGFGQYTLSGSDLESVPRRSEFLFMMSAVLNHTTDTQTTVRGME